MAPPPPRPKEATVSIRDVFRHWGEDFSAMMPAQQSSRSAKAVHYGFALVMVVLALGIRELIGSADLGLQFVMFFPAVALTAVYGGFWPGMLATTISAILATFFYMPPYHSFSLDFERAMLVSNLIFFLDGLVVCGAIQAMHHHYRNFRAASERAVEKHNILNAIVEGTCDLIFVKDTSGRPLLCNGAHVGIFGKKWDALVGRDPFTLFSVEHDAEVITSGKVMTYEEVIGSADGEARNFLTTKGPVFDERGDIKAVFGIARDITDRKRAEAVLRESEHRFKTLAAGTFEGIAILVEGKFLDVNDCLIQMLGYERCELIGRNVKGFIPQEDQERVMGLIDAGLESNTEHEMLCKDGSRRIVEAHGRTIEEGGRRIRLIAFRDITQQKRVEDALRLAQDDAERANNAKSRFLAAASHDLRQPLSALGLYVGVLKNKLAPADAPLLNSMKNCVSSLSELLTDLLDLSKLDAGVVTPEMSDFAVTDLLDNLISVHAPEALLKGLHLRCVASRLNARTDMVLFRRILGNLIANAIRYTERGGVLVGCRRRQGKTWIEVRDSGIGIPEDRINEIFEEFKQLDHDERNRGSGLGLSIVAKTAALLGLRIRVRSWPGKGSVFAVELPLGRASKAAARHDTMRRPLRIALVDDNAGVLNALICALEAVGHQTVAAATGTELIGLLGNEAPDIVISDYRLADGQTGFDVIAATRKSFGDTLPAFLITGDSDPKLMRSMADRGIVVQHKPLEIDALQMCIEQATTRRLS